MNPYCNIGIISTGKLHLLWTNISFFCILKRSSHSCKIISFILWNSFLTDAIVIIDIWYWQCLDLSYRAGLKLLSPGGSLVYSTCTLSMPQNDGTVQAALEDIWQNTDLDVAVVRTPAISDRFRDFFHFHDNCRLGQLVIPNVTANFGPSYFCKLRRVN